MQYPGLLDSLTLVPNPAVGHIIKISATNVATVNSNPIEIATGNNFTFQYEVNNFAGGASYLAIFFYCALHDDVYMPLQLPVNPNSTMHPGFTMYELNIDGFMVKSTGLKQGTVIIPNQFNKVKIGAVTDAGTADLYIRSITPSIS